MNTIECALSFYVLWIALISWNILDALASSILFASFCIKAHNLPSLQAWKLCEHGQKIFFDFSNAVDGFSPHSSPACNASKMNYTETHLFFWVHSMNDQTWGGKRRLRSLSCWIDWQLWGIPTNVPGSAFVVRAAGGVAWRCAPVAKGPVVGTCENALRMFTAWLTRFKDLQSRCCFPSGSLGVSHQCHRLKLCFCTLSWNKHAHTHTHESTSADCINTENWSTALTRRKDSDGVHVLNALWKFLGHSEISFSDTIRHFGIMSVCHKDQSESRHAVT